MIRNLLILLVLSVVLMGCTGSQVRGVSDDIANYEQEITRVEDLLNRVDEILDNPAVPDSVKQDAAVVKARLDAYLDRMESELPLLRQRLATLELSEGESVGNALLAIGEVGSTVGAVFGGPYAPLAVGISGLLGVVGGWLNGRKKGVDMALETVENAEVPITMTKDILAQQEIIRKGNKAVAQGVARLVAKQGVGG